MVVDSGIADPFAWMSKRLRDDEKLEVDHDQLSKAVDVCHGMFVCLAVFVILSFVVTTIVNALCRFFNLPLRVFLVTSENLEISKEIS